MEEQELLEQQKRVRRYTMGHCGVLGVSLHAFARVRRTAAPVALLSLVADPLI